MRFLRTPLAAILLPVAAGLLLALSPSGASAVSFHANFRSSFYQVTAGDGYGDLLAAYFAGAPLASVSMPGLENVSAQVEAGVSGDYSILLTASIDVGVSGQYEFQVGADWGRGGVAAVLDGSGNLIHEVVRVDDIWWANDWNNPDVFTTVLTLDAGSSYTFVWLGFEGCCGGVTTIRFSFAGGAFQTLNDPNVLPFVAPEPGVGLLVALGLTLLATRRRATAP